MLSRYLPLIVLWVMFAIAPSSLQADVTFTDLSLDQVRSEASQSQVPFLVYLHQPQAHLCKKMARKTWKDTQLGTFISQHFLAAQINPLQGKSGLALVQEYAVFSYPAVLFFSPQGKLMGKAEGYLAPATLLTMLKKHHRTLQKQEDIRLWALHNQPAPAKAPNLLAEAEIPRGETEALSLTLLFEPNLPEELPATPPVAMEALQSGMRTRGLDGDTYQLLLEVPGMEAYSLNQLHLPSDMPLSYGLLIGSYTSFKDLGVELERMKRYWRDEIWVYCEEINQTPIYKLVLGVYPSEEDAETFAHAIYKIQGLNPIVLDLGVFLR